MGAFDSDLYQEIKDELSYFGLEKTDSEIYLTLLEFGPSTMSELATKLEVDRGKIYRAMERLQDLGMVIQHNSKITSCEAVKPEEALMMIIERKKTKISELRQAAKNIEKELEQITRPIASSSMSAFSIIEGRNSIYARIGKLIQDAQDTVYLITTSEDLSRMFQTAIPEKIKLAIQKNVHVNIAVDSHSEILQNLSNQYDISNIKIGTLPSKSRIIVERKSHLLMSGAIKETNSLTEQSESILYSDSPEMIENMFSLCEQIWKKTKTTILSK